MVQSPVLVFVKKHWKAIVFSFLILTNLVAAGIAYFSIQNLNNTKNELREANTVINARVDEIQEFDRKLGIADSKLKRKSKLNEKYKEEIEKFKKEIDEKTDKIKASELSIKSKDKTIAELKGIVKGTSSVSVDNKEGTFETIITIDELLDGNTVTYEWSDAHNRFNLKDPDISISGNEEFTYNQTIIVRGTVLTDSSGNVQVKKVEVEEVIKVEDDGEVSYRRIDGSKVNLIHSNFEYTNEQKKEEFDWFAPITLRPLVGFDTALSPSIGIEVLNFGRWVPYANIGLVQKIAFDVSDPLGGSLQNSRIGAGIIYHFVPPLMDTNIGAGISVSTPFNDLGRLVLTADLIFYLTQDLFPF